MENKPRFTNINMVETRNQIQELAHNSIITFFWIPNKQKIIIINCQVAMKETIIKWTATKTLEHFINMMTSNKKKSNKKYNLQKKRKSIIF
jgi:hypothetical protein